MRSCRLYGDLSLLRQGVEVAVGFGIRSLEGLAEVANLLEQSVYEPGSLARTPDGFAFTLLNPPLRMGAFSSVRILWNGHDVDPGIAAIRLPGLPDRPLSGISVVAPVTIPVGSRTGFSVASREVARGRHHLRLELQSVAVPPRVWFEFSDEMTEREGSLP
jgi:hypothetical protein